MGEGPEHSNASTVLIGLAIVVAALLMWAGVIYAIMALT